MLDPFRMYARGLHEAEVVRLRDVTSEDFRSSEYFRTYYLGSHLSDEINFLIPVLPDQVAAVGIGRSQSLLPFDDAQIVNFCSWLPMISAVMRRHLALPGALADLQAREREDHEHNRLEARLATFGTNSLTPREHEIVQHLLRGSSAPDIAGRLSVSLQTVRVHRRNIYSKLEVSSLGQLFSLAMHNLLTTGET